MSRPDPDRMMHRHAFEVGFPLHEVAALHAGGSIDGKNFLISAVRIVARSRRTAAVEPSAALIRALSLCLRAVERGDEDLRLDDLHYAIRCWSDELRDLAGCNEPTVPL